MKHLATRLLVCSPDLPPSQNGGAMVLERILRDIDPADYCLSGFGPEPEIEARFVEGPLKARTHRLARNWRYTGAIPPGYRLRPVRWLRGFSGEVLPRARRLARLLRDERCGALLIPTSQHTPDMLAGVLASRMANVPLFVYMLDNWRYMLAFQDPTMGRYAKYMQSLVLAGARGVLVPNQFMADELARDHGRESVVVGIPPPSPVPATDVSPDPWPRQAGQVSLVFTGNVYGAHFDALARVLNALESPRLESVTLHLYTSNPERFMRDQGLTGRVEFHPHVEPHLIQEVQRKADILLLPLSFRTPYPEIINAAAPTKTGEYLASGRPILIHAPPDSYLAALAREHGVGALVDQPAPELIVDAILRIANDGAYRAQITAAAQAAARLLYSPAATTDRFVETLNEWISTPVST
jgi:glycosyltransferase involved in cell wall biosynthesis